MLSFLNPDLFHVKMFNRKDLVKKSNQNAKAWNIYLLYGPKVLITCHLFHPALWICSSTGTLTSVQPPVTRDSHVISCLFSLWLSLTCAACKKNDLGHTSLSVNQERLLIEYTSHCGHCKEQALPSHIDRPLCTLSCLMHLEVGQFAVPHHQYALHSLGYFLSMGSIPVIMTGEILKDHPMWYSDMLLLPESDDLLKSNRNIWCFPFQVKDTVLVESGIVKLYID